MDERIAGEAVGPFRVTRPSLHDLYGAHSAAALRLAYLLVGDTELAQDLVQDAFVRVFGRYRDLRDPGNFDAYLRKTIVNLSKDHHRKRRSERAFLEKQNRAERAVTATETDEALRSALMKLPERQRCALALRYLEDLSEQQTADVMGSSVSAVKSLTQRGSAALREMLGGAG